jgi:CheY-like chemotaxis protein
MALKILLVEDDEVFRTLLLIALEGEGHTVLEAAHGRAALELIERERPDLIISDLDMPGLNGPALCQRVRANPRLAHIPFVILSAFIEPGGEHEWPDPKADRYFSKQASFSQLLRWIETLTARLS